MRHMGRCGQRVLLEPVAADAHGMPCPHKILPMRAALWESQTVPNQRSSGATAILETTGLLVLGRKVANLRRACVFGREGERGRTEE